MSVGFLKDFQKEEFLVATLVRGMPTNACGKGDGVGACKRDRWSGIIFAMPGVCSKKTGSL